MIATMYQIPFQEKTIFVFGGIIKGHEIAIRLGIGGVRLPEAVRHYDLKSVCDFMDFQMELEQPVNWLNPPEMSTRHSQRVSFTTPIAFNGPAPFPLLGCLLCGLGAQDNHRTGLEIILWGNGPALSITDLKQEMAFTQAICDFFTPSTEPYKW